MKGKKILLLFLALALPSFVFVFLKMFGKNQFDVPALFSAQVPAATGECGLEYELPYHVPDSVLGQVMNPQDSLAVIVFSAADAASLDRVKEKYGTGSMTWKSLDPATNVFLQRCIFLLAEPFDVVLVDRKGLIRGHYNSADRDEIDRLVTEIAILLKKY